MKTRANTVTNKKGNKSKCSNEFSNIFAERLKHAREKRGITQEQLAEKLGITPRTLQSYESACTVNVRVPNLEIVSQIATILECDITYLTGENDIDILRKTVGSASKITKLSMDNIERLEKLKPAELYALNQMLVYFPRFLHSLVESISLMNHNGHISVFSNDERDTSEIEQRLSEYNTKKVFQYDLQNQMTDIIELIFEDEYFRDMAIKESHEYVEHIYQNSKQTILDMAENDSNKVSMQELLATLPDE